MPLNLQRGFNKAPFNKIITLDAETSIVYTIFVDTELEIQYLISKVTLSPRNYTKGFNKQGFNRISRSPYVETDLEIQYLIQSEIDLSILYDLLFAEVDLVISYELSSYYIDLNIQYQIQSEKDISILYTISQAEIDFQYLYRILSEKALEYRYSISQAEIDLSMLYLIVTGEMIEIIFGGVTLPGAKQDGYEDYNPTVNEVLIHDGTQALSGSPELKYEVTFYCAAMGTTEFELVRGMIGGYYTLWVRGYRYKNCMITGLRKRNLGSTNAVEFIVTFKQDTSKERE